MKEPSLANKTRCKSWYERNRERKKAYSREYRKSHKQLQELFDFVLAKDKDWSHSYKLLGHGYQLYLAECIGFMDELKKKFEGLKP